jgi:glutaredoxin 3
MVDENPSYMDEMIKITGEKTVPQIFIGDKHIGGFEQLRSINNDGSLDKLILED